MPKRVRHRLFPFLDWIKGYQLTTFKSDALAGLTVAVVLIPQAMAYAMLAGMPPVHGLYAAAVTPMVGALWGSLRQLSTGPIAIMSLLVLTTLTPIAEPGSARFIELAFVLTFMVGMLYLGIGAFGLGAVMYFISHSAVKGFTSAAALIIIATQLPHFLGVPVPRHEYIFPMLVDLLKSLPAVHVPTVAVGLLSVGMIYNIKKYRKNWPAGLIALVVISGLLAVFEWYEKGIAIVGKIPGGLPRLHIPQPDVEIISSLLGPAVVMALVSFAETYSVGKAISAETNQKVDVDQEFIGQGLANLVGSFFQGYPVSGSFSRTAINFAAGAKTGMSSVVASFSVLAALMFLTPLLNYIPRAALAALVMSAVLALFHPREVFNLWKMNRHDGIVALSVFILALSAKPDYALLIGVLVSLIFFLWKTMHPRIVRVSKDPELNMFINADEYQKPGCPQILQLRSDNVIYFANAEYTTEHIVDRLDEQATPVKFLLLDFQAVGFVDITGVDELRSLFDEVKSRGIGLTFVNVHRPVRKVFESSGFLNHLNPDSLLVNSGKAIAFLFRQIDHGYCKNVCPYRIFNECSTVK